MKDISGSFLFGITGHGSITGGADGTDGTFALAFTGGTGSGAAGTFTVESGALTAITITSPGAYSVAPTFSFAASAGLTGASASVTLASTAQVLAAANGRRNGFRFQNISAGDLWINDLAGDAAIDTAGSMKIAAGGFYQTPPLYDYQGAISIIGATNGQKYTASEY